MASTGYQLGTALERRVVELFTKAGWFAVRSPRSAGPADVLAIRRMKNGTRAVMVNCKRDIRQCRPEDWNATFRAAREYGAVPLVAGRNPGRRGVVFMRILAEKRPGATGRPQPWEPYDIA